MTAPLSVGSAPAPHGAGDVPASVVLASVVVPAHNEESVIGRCLAALSAGLPVGALDVIVVCNGCTDGTAAAARARGVRVIETDRANKAAALNTGDAAAMAFPRFYVDADVEVAGSALLEVAAVLRTGAALAAAPALRPCMTGVARPVRDYYRIWMRLPYVADGHVGSGVVGVGDVGRKRFARFPEAIADDLYLYHQFSAEERVTVDSVHFTVYPARTVRDFVRRKVRVYAGNIELRNRGLVPVENRNTGGASWLSVVAADRRLLTAAPAYLAISAVAKLLAVRKVRRGDLGSWERDDSSRRLPEETT
ncbi:glycosyltransferase [Parafrankia discariae]|uniref:glycosyltransferase n=1 Tax=Parafrankia discariae TaxID=365528 RepID=UPI000375A3A3|nr:glycosyltransferase [Parafrankia discariae]